MHDLVDRDGNDSSKKDCNAMRHALEKYEFTSIISLEVNTQITKVISAVSSIKKRCRESPAENFLIVYVLASHGMIVDGQQVVLLNQFDERTRYYKMWSAERDIREIAETFANSY